MTKVKQEDMAVYRYVLGFLFSPDLDFIVLMKKTHGALTAQGWNGLGGLIKPYELETDAISREAEEESGISVPGSKWYYAGCMLRPNTIINVYTAISPDYSKAASKTDELVDVWSMAVLPLQISPQHHLGTQCADGLIEMVTKCRDKLEEILRPIYIPFVIDRVHS